MSGEPPPPVRVRLADELAPRAAWLADAWVDRLSAGAGGSRPGPPEALRECARGVVAVVLAALRTGEAGDAGALRELARLRREQEAPLEEVVGEVEVLARLVTAAGLEAMRGWAPAPDALEAAEAVERVRAALAAVTASLVALHRQAERERDSELSRRLEEFAHMIVHELKNPLSNIQIGTDLLQEHLAAGAAGAGEESARYLGWIARGVRRAMDLLDDVRVLALAEGAQAEGRWAPARAVVENVFAQVRDSAAGHGVVCQVVEPLPEGEVDAVRVGVALMNLVGNAIKYSDPAKPERWVRVAAEREVDGFPRWRFSVADNGLGIPRAMHHKVFRRHFRAHPDAAEGTGLGLAITQQVIEQGHGRLWFESEEGVGSVFHFVAPEGRESPGPRPRPAAPLATA